MLLTLNDPERRALRLVLEVACAALRESESARLERADTYRSIGQIAAALNLRPEEQRQWDDLAAAIEALGAPPPLRRRPHCLAPYDGDGIAECQELLDAKQTIFELQQAIAAIADAERERARNDPFAPRPARKGTVQ